MKTFDPVLNYEPRRKNQIQIDELLLNQVQQNKSQQWKNIA